MSSGASPSPDAKDELLGSVLADRYRLDELLGEGGMGRVYAAEHVLMRKRLAVKVLHRELCEVPEVVARFEREAMAVANIEHPNVAAATDCGKLSDGTLFLVLELVEGTNLRDEIARGPLPVARVLHIVRQIASALGAAHALSIVHRDLKPENVMLVTRGADSDFVKVLDFGIAKLPVEAQGRGAPAAAPLTRVGVVFGTPEYMAPEQALGQAVDGRADLYSLGVIAYEMLAGVRPIAAASDVAILGRQLAGPPPPISERAPGVVVPLAVEQLVLELLAREAGARPATAEELVARLDALEPLDANEALETPPSRRTGQQFTEPEAAATAVLGTAAELYAAAPPPVEAAATEQEASASPASAPVAEGSQASASVRLGLPPLHSLRHALRDVPPRALLALPLLAVWLVLLLVVSWVVLGRGKPAAGVAPGDEPPAQAASLDDGVMKELEVAKQQGHAALAALAERHSAHPLVLLELAVSHAERAEHPAAVAALGRSLSADPTLGAEPRAARLLEVAVRKRESSEAAFSLLEGQMGAAGAAVLYDLSIDQKVNAATRSRAQKWVVQSADFIRVAAPSVEIAARLRYAKSCSDRHALLPRAGEVGDQRALAYLKILKVRGGCGRRGRDDCFPCLRKDKALADASLAIEKRLSGGR
ncbi:MAG: serine/threonine protein kinase [Polyangiaceae bacterium]|nr:serine/threonine protein kinase [Polyangiaceae bacterium]